MFAAFQSICEWVDRANTNDLTPDLGENGDYNISVTDEDGYGTILFEAHSDRTSNLEWQMERLLEFVKTLKGLAYFEAPILTEHKYILWDSNE
jgi:hypothetical protein